MQRGASEDGDQRVIYGPVDETRDIVPICELLAMRGILAKDVEPLRKVRARQRTAGPKILVIAACQRFEPSEQRPVVKRLVYDTSRVGDRDTVLIGHCAYAGDEGLHGRQ
jgi:hypothetical protein